jgi:hypothetical protein
MKRHLNGGPRSSGREWGRGVPATRASLVAGLLLALLGGCGDRAPSATVPQASAEPAVLTDHVPVQAAAPTRAVGESCDTGGASECRSGFCLRISPDPRKGRVCSALCKDDAGCPRTWRCTQLHPSAGGQACTPPEGWEGAVAEPR